MSFKIYQHFAFHFKSLKTLVNTLKNNLQYIKNALFKSTLT